MITPLTIAGGLAGVGLGLAQQAKREQNASRNELMARWQYDTLKKRNDAQKAILEGNLTVGAMNASSNNREAAIQAFQQESIGEVKAGLSGASGGTPLFKVASDMALNRLRLAEMTTGSRLQYDSAIREARAAGTEIDMNLQSAMWGLQEAVDQLNYVESPMARAMSVATGVASGASMANNLNTAVVELTGYSVEDNFANAFDKIETLFGKKPAQSGLQIERSSVVDVGSYSSSPAGASAIGSRPDSLSFATMVPFDTGFQRPPNPSSVIGMMPGLDASLDIFQIPSLSGITQPGFLGMPWQPTSKPRGGASFRF